MQVCEIKLALYPYSVLPFVKEFNSIMMLNTLPNKKITTDLGIRFCHIKERI